MSDLKKMYTTLTADPFPGDMVITVGGQELLFKKRTWQLQDGEKGLRYGENPDQPAALYELVSGGLTLDAVRFRGPGEGIVSSMTEQEMLQAGKHPGKINLTDVDNGINILQYLTAKPAAVILKHNNPSGAAWSDLSVADALHKAYLGDRIAAFGGAIVVNRTLDEESAEFINSVYFEVVAAPGYSGKSLEILKKRKNLRILRLPALADLVRLQAAPYLDIKSLVDGGLIVQLSFQNRIRSVEDFLPALAEKDGIAVAARKPTPREAQDLLFAWAVESGVTSNSVIFARDGATVSIGTGEQDRVGCVQLAIHKAYTKYADKLAFDEHNLSLYQLQEKAKTDSGLADALEQIKERTAAARGGLPGSVLVSDGFFPFRDGVDLALEQGVVAIAQPGGSIRDTEIIGAVNEAVPQVAMVFTGQRSFKH
jgi:phosphoribosylaminoimidazolecarboxamide formyltransferase / IMP cyclohydrolase